MCLHNQTSKVEPNIKPSTLQDWGQQEALAGVGSNGGASSAQLSSCHKPHKHLVFISRV